MVIRTVFVVETVFGCFAAFLFHQLFQTGRQFVRRWHFVDQRIVIESQFLGQITG
jgi:hypothetical protein